ncbi:hypothetical protein DYB25_008650 [Aphanomyces astaci]|uniref:Uncharacterized protein n=1 Tax=Aphanomyces astaci TaxID=112090 RepID=A0A397BFK9_APHAT|nr:hypothetical protein DYB25_008650 [Aphanomyces astaci]
MSVCMPPKSMTISTTSTGTTSCTHVGVPLISNVHEESSTPISTPTLLPGTGMSIPSPYMLSGRKKSSSFSDLGDYDECSDIGTPEKPGMFKPPPIHEEMMDTAFRLNDPTQDRASLIDSGITFLAGEVLKLRLDNVAYIVFYKPDASTGVIPNTGGDSSPSFNPMESTDVSPPSPVDLASSIMTYDSSSGGYVRPFIGMLTIPA